MAPKPSRWSGRHPWDVLLLDLKMPGMDGIETLKNVKEISPEIEVLMMTAYATVDTAVQAMKLGLLIIS